MTDGHCMQMIVFGLLISKRCCEPPMVHVVIVLTDYTKGNEKRDT